MHKNSFLPFLILTITLSSVSMAIAQCPPISLLTTCLGQDVGAFDAAMIAAEYEMSNVVTLSNGKTVYSFIQQPDESAKITITTNPEGVCMNAKLESVFMDCWEAFLITAKTDPATYVYKLGADEEMERLGVYDISGIFRVHGSSRIKSDGRTEIGLMVSKL